MKKTAMRSYAVIGVHARLLEMEQELRALYRSFPETFIDAPPPLARPELKNGASSNGHGAFPPIVVGKPKRKTKTRKRSSGSYRPRSERRAETAAILARVEKAGSLPASKIGRAIGSYVRRGYLKKQGDGYARTAKPFEP